MTYEHVLLPHGPEIKYIRLLNLQPGNGEPCLDFLPAPIRINQGSTAPYEALSYVWGSQLDLVEVKLGVSGSDERKPKPRQAIQVTRNLASALQHLRYPDRPRTLWIDAICIDQDDLEEKQRQVNFMGDVFERANRVVVWLGPAADDSDRALAVLAEIGSQVAVNWSKGEMRPAQGAHDLTLGDDKAPFPDRFTELDAAAVETLFSRSWFERIWVRQELSIARAAIFQVGYATVPRLTLQNAVFCIWYKHHSPDGPSPLSRLSRAKRTWTVFTMCQPFHHFSPVWLHSYTEGMYCTNPRDRVYGLLRILRGISDNDGGSGSGASFMPDYKAPITTCYRDAALHFITTHRSLSLLACCGLSTPTSLLDQCSWVPDWSTDLDRDLCGPISLGAGMFLSQTSCPSSSILRVTGLEYDAVRFTKMFDLSSDLSFLLSLRKACCAMFPVEFPTQSTITISMDVMGNEQMYLVTDESWLGALVRTFCMDKFSENSRPSDLRSVLTLERAQQALRHLLMMELEHLVHILSPISSAAPTSVARAPTCWSDDSDQDLRILFNCIRCRIAGRCVFMTSKQVIGLGPASVEPGDKVCLLLGNEFPIILRPMHVQADAADTPALGNDIYKPCRSEDKDHFTVLGDCFVPGIMAGEPLLGPLPSHIRPILQHVENAEGYQARFLDTQTDETILEDPRIQIMSSQLSALGDENSRHGHNLLPSENFFGDNGEPRYEVTSDDFIMLGVNIQDFDLV